MWCDDVIVVTIFIYNSCDVIVTMEYSKTVKSYIKPTDN
jgi:hypothetical protein